MGKRAAVPVLVLLALALLSPGCRPEPNGLVQKYGHQLFSKGNEELIIRDFFQDRKGGFFVDVGANHYQVESTTYYLEKFLDWRGLAIDAVCDFDAGYREFRKNTRFFCFYISDRSDASVDFYVTQKNYERRSSTDRDWAAKYGKAAKTKVQTVTLNDLLEREGASAIDFLSMDIELAEPAALAGFDIEKYRPALVCIELHKEVRQQIIDYFTRHGYGLLEKYREADAANGYFAPLR
jgi:FkbM family methyltransferase